MGKVVKNSLGFGSDLYVYQDKSMFNYSVDTIMLGNFVTVTKNTRYFLDVGTNNGALALFIAERSSLVSVDAVEIQKEALELAKKNIMLNKKAGQIKLFNEDFNHFVTKHNKAQQTKYDVIVCNPPFYKVNQRLPLKPTRRNIATYEIKLNLDQLCKGSSQIINQKGYLTVVLPTERLVDICETMRKHRFEPKRIQFIHPRVNQKSNLVLVESRFQSGWGTRFLPNLYLHGQNLDNHEYLPEIKKLYKPKKLKESKPHE